MGKIYPLSSSSSSSDGESDSYRFRLRKFSSASSRLMSPNPNSISWKSSAKRLNCLTHAMDSCTLAFAMAPITAPKNPTGVWFLLHICIVEIFS